MRTITSSIRELLERSPFLTEAIAQGIVNYSSLARKLKPYLEKIHLRPFTVGAIVMALRSARRTGISPFLSGPVGEYVRSMIVHSNLVQFAFHNHDELLVVEQQLLERIRPRSDAVVFFARGHADTGIILSESLEKDLETLTKDLEEFRLAEHRGLSSISIRFTADIVDRPGVYYPFFQALAWSGVNVVQLVTGFAELTLIFKERDLERAFATIKPLTEKRRA